MQARAVVPTLVAIFLVACPSTRREAPPADQGSQTRAVCGLPVTDAPAARPVDACRGGEVVLTPFRVHREAGPPVTVQRPFELTEGGAACVVARSDGDDGRHRVASARVYVDGEEVIGSGAFSQNAVLAEAPLTLSPGAHTLSAELRSAPGTSLEIEVRVGGESERTGRVDGSHLELFDLFAQPAAFAAGIEQTVLTAGGTVLRFSGLPSNSTRYVVRWAFEVRDAERCTMVRRLLGESSALDGSFTATAAWDGRDSSGQVLSEGPYAYRLIATLVVTGSDGERPIETLATAQQLLLLDSGPPEVRILQPADSAPVTSLRLPVEIVWNDTGAGVDLASARIRLDETDVTGELAVALGGATGELDLVGLAAGDHRLRAEVADRLGSLGQAEVGFRIDRRPVLPGGGLSMSGGGQASSASYRILVNVGASRGASASSASYGLTLGGGPIQHTSR